VHCHVVSDSLSPYMATPVSPPPPLLRRRQISLRSFIRPQEIVARGTLLSPFLLLFPA
jgi:hypothetical protein